MNIGMKITSPVCMTMTLSMNVRKEVSAPDPRLPLRPVAANTDNLHHLYPAFAFLGLGFAASMHLGGWVGEGRGP